MKPFLRCNTDLVGKKLGETSSIKKFQNNLDKDTLAL